MPCEKGIRSPAYQSCARCRQNGCGADSARLRCRFSAAAPRIWRGYAADPAPLRCGSITACTAGPACPRVLLSRAFAFTSVRVRGQLQPRRSGCQPPSFIMDGPPIPLRTRRVLPAVVQLLRRALPSRSHDIPRHTDVWALPLTPGQYGLDYDPASDRHAAGATHDAEAALPRF